MKARYFIYSQRRRAEGVPEQGPAGAVVCKGGFPVAVP